MPDDIPEHTKPVSTDVWSQVLEDPDVREAGGEHVNEGVDFARYWAVSALVGLELAGESDYVFLFEYLQDVAILNSACNPTQAVLYQVKKKERGGWSRSDLCKKEVAQLPVEGAKSNGGKRKKRRKLGAASPIGKLYLCVDRLSPHVTTSGVFLSNAPLSLKLANGALIPSYSKTSLSELLQEDLLHIEKSIASELGVRCPLPTCKALLLEQTKVAPAAMRETIRGIVAEYLLRQFPAVPNVSGQLVERLVDSFSRRSGPQPLMRNLAEIVAQKGFTRFDFTEVVKEASCARAFETRLDRIFACLVSEGFPSRLLTKIQDSAVQIQTQLVREPATKESLHWDVAIAAAETSIAADYKTAITQVETQLVKSFDNASSFKPNETDLWSIAILAIMYVEEQPPAPSAQHQN